MSTLRKHLLIGMAALSLSAGTLAVHAQQPAGAQEQGQVQERMQERMAKRVADLHDKLKLTPNQEAAWKTYVERMKPSKPSARLDRAEFDKLSAPERMERIHARMQEREKRMGERVAATKQFYAVLSPEQQKVFNEEFRMGKGHKHGRHGHERGQK